MIKIAKFYNRFITNSYDIEGIRNNFITNTMDIKLVDEVIKVTDLEAYDMVKLIDLKKE